MHSRGLWARRADVLALFMSQTHFGLGNDFVQWGAVQQEQRDWNLALLKQRSVGCCWLPGLTGHWNETLRSLVSVLWSAIAQGWSHRAHPLCSLNTKEKLNIIYHCNYSKCKRKWHTMHIITVWWLQGTVFFPERRGIKVCIPARDQNQGGQNYGRKRNAHEWLDLAEMWYLRQTEEALCEK